MMGKVVSIPDHIDDEADRIKLKDSMYKTGAELKRSEFEHFLRLFRQLPLTIRLENGKSITINGRKNK